MKYELPACAELCSNNVVSRWQNSCCVSELILNALFYFVYKTDSLAKVSSFTLSENGMVVLYIQMQML